MDDGEVEVSDHISFPNLNFSESMSMDTFLDEFLKNMQTCTHTHTCNPPGPDATHTHTCYHTHTQVLANGEDEESGEQHQSISKSRKPLGNREAVRKYREKKKAQTAYLEEEVKKLHLVNQQLLRRLQGQALLEAEVLRLRSLLIDLRRKIDVELGVFPFQKQCNGTSFKEGDCNLKSIECETDVPCLHQLIGSSSVGGIGGSTKMVSWEGSCEPAIVDCRTNPNGDMGQNLESSAAHFDCMISNAMDVVGGVVSATSQSE